MLVFFSKRVVRDQCVCSPSGDKIVVASTDYDYAQAEEMDIIVCLDCAHNEFRTLRKY